MQKSASKEQAQNISVHIDQVTTMYCLNDEVYSPTIINNRDPDLLAAFKEVMQGNGGNVIKDAVIELQDLLGQLKQANPKNYDQSKSVIRKISDKLGEVKKFGDNIKGMLPYLTHLYKIIQPLADSHGIHLPPLPR